MSAQELICHMNANNNLKSFRNEAKGETFVYFCRLHASEEPNNKRKNIHRILHIRHRPIDRDKIV